MSITSLKYRRYQTKSLKRLLIACKLKHLGFNHLTRSVFGLLFLFFCHHSMNAQALLVENDTLIINLDSLMMVEKPTVNCPIKKSACGNGTYRIPIRVIGTDTSKYYFINMFRGNGASMVAPVDRNNSLIVPENGLVQTDWYLLESLNKIDCSQNRSALTIRITYQVVFKPVGLLTINCHQYIRIVYQYVD